MIVNCSVKRRMLTYEYEAALEKDGLISAIVLSRFNLNFVGCWLDTKQEV